MSYTALVSALSADVQARMALANFPPLQTGSIELGPQHRPEWEHGSPPRIVMVPDGVKFAVVNPAARFTTQTANAEQHAMIAAKVIWQETKLFTVHVWNVTYVNGECSPSSDTDWDVTEALYQLFIQSCHVLFHGRYRVTTGQWVDSSKGSAVRATIGRELMFKLEVDTPVLDVTYPFVPPGSTYSTLTVVSYGASSGDAIHIITPKV
jgi:hypothetical protein